MDTLYRTQVLLEPEQHKRLKEIARYEGRSLSDVMREIVREYLAELEAEATRQRELQAIEDLAQLRSRILEQHGVYQGDLIAETWDERERDNERIWRGEP